MSIDDWAEKLAKDLVEAGETEYAPSYRDAIIEECARVAENYLSDTDNYWDGNAIAAAIRALKDKP